MKLFHFQTNQIQLFKCLVESLKEIMIETNLELSSQHIKISKINALNRICCVVQLNGTELNQNGNSYECQYPEDKPLIVGINLLHISKILRNIGTDNILHLEVKESNKNVLCIQVEMTNRLIVSTYTINFIEVNVENLSFPDTAKYEFDKTVEIEAKYFQKQIKELNNLDSEYVEIIVCDNQMIIQGSGGFITKSTQIYMPENEINPSSNKTKYLRTIELFSHSNQLFQGKYFTKDLLCISKFTNLSPTFILKLKNDIPLLLMVNIESFGKVTLIISSSGIINWLC